MEIHLVAIHKSSPAELLELLRDHLHQHGQIQYVLCTKIELLGPFYYCSVVENIKDTAPWNIHIPTGCIVAIADMSKNRASLGFLPDS